MTAPKPAFMKLKACKVPSRGGRDMLGVDDDAPDTFVQPNGDATPPSPPVHRKRRKLPKAAKQP